MKSLSIIDQIPSDWFQQQTKNGFLLGGLQHSDLLSSLATLHNHIFICDPGILFPLLINAFLLCGYNVRDYSLPIFVSH